MDTKRIIIEVPQAEHKRLKMKAAEHGTSMKELILEAIRLMDNNACKTSSHEPNEVTLQAMKNASGSKDLLKGKKAEEALKKLGL
jgi:plasmid stability protein